jgi:hypothetical protein
MNFFEFLQQNWSELFALTREHLFLVLISTFFAVLIGVPLGILLTREKISANAGSRNRQCNADDSESRAVRFADSAAARSAASARKRRLSRWRFIRFCRLFATR